MRFLWRWTLRLGMAVLIALLLLLSPVAYVELACRGTNVAQSHQPLLPPEHRRAESRSFTTFPEWHIVHAYEDYAKVIATADPHDFGFLRAAAGFWTSLCPMARLAGEHGGFTSDQKATIYTIGVSFTAELALKAAYEETLGRVAIWIRGDTRAELDDLTARQAADYAAFLQQVPWYQWDFQRDLSELAIATVYGPRDLERRIALGAEYSAKSAYAGVIARAVTGLPPDALTIRSVVAGLSPEALGGIEGVAVMATRAEGTEIETARYRTFTHVVERIVAAGGDLVEIAGNDDILLTLTSAQPSRAGALHSAPRQGFADWRHLLVVKVADLDQVILGLAGGQSDGFARLEHIHDY